MRGQLCFWAPGHGAFDVVRNKTERRKSMPFYETVFIARQDLTPSQVDELTESFTKIIKDNGGKVHKTENWGLRTLTYRIQKNRKAHYVLIETDTPPAALHEMERNMRLNENVLRYLSVREEKLSEGPSVVLERGSRDDDAPRERHDGPRHHDRHDGPRHDRPRHDTPKQEEAA
jgi:small subunit ribosomal protein S6